MFACQALAPAPADWRQLAASGLESGATLATLLWEMALARVETSERSAAPRRPCSIASSSSTRRCFLQHAREASGRRLPKYVENELRRYLECDLHAHGFGRAVCETCGAELLLPFSCKLRGTCPSCNSRSMSNMAASGLAWRTITPTRGELSHALERGAYTVKHGRAASEDVGIEDAASRAHRRRTGVERDRAASGNPLCRASSR